MIKKLKKFFVKEKAEEKPIFIPPDSFVVDEPEGLDEGDILAEVKVDTEAEATSEFSITPQFIEEYPIDDREEVSLNSQNVENDLSILPKIESLVESKFVANYTSYTYSLDKNDILHRVLIKRIVENVVNNREFMTILSGVILRRLVQMDNQATKLVLNYLSKDPRIFEKRVIYSITEKFGIRIKEEVLKYNKNEIDKFGV